MTIFANPRPKAKRPKAAKRRTKTSSIRECVGVVAGAKTRFLLIPLPPGGPRRRNPSIRESLARMIRGKQTERTIGLGNFQARLDRSGRPVLVLQSGVTGKTISLRPKKELRKFLKAEEPEFVQWAEKMLQEMTSGRRSSGGFFEDYDNPKQIPARAEARKTPRRTSAVNAAAGMFETWHEYPAHSVTRLNRPLRFPKAMAELGRPVELIYNSRKYTGKSTNYVHAFKGKDFFMAANPQGTAVVIARRDGKPFAKNEGLV